MLARYQAKGDSEVERLLPKLYQQIKQKYSKLDTKTKEGKINHAFYRQKYEEKKIEEAIRKHDAARAKTQARSLFSWPGPVESQE